MSETNETPKRPSGHLGTMDDVGQTHYFDLFAGSLVITTKIKGMEGVSVRHVSQVDIEAYRRAILRGLLPDDPLARLVEVGRAAVEEERACIAWNIARDAQERAGEKFYEAERVTDNLARAIIESEGSNG